MYMGRTLSRNLKSIMLALCWHTKIAYYAQSNASILCLSLFKTDTHSHRIAEFYVYMYILAGLRDLREGRLSYTRHPVGSQGTTIQE